MMTIIWGSMTEEITPDSLPQVISSKLKPWYSVQQRSKKKRYKYIFFFFSATKTFFPHYWLYTVLETRAKTYCSVHSISEHADWTRKKNYTMKHWYLITYRTLSSFNPDKAFGWIKARSLPASRLEKIAIKIHT